MITPSSLCFGRLSVIEWRGKMELHVDDLTGDLLLNLTFGCVCGFELIMSVVCFFIAFKSSFIYFI